MQITTIGFDLAKHVFQIHGIDANEAIVEKRRLRRGQVLSYFAKLPPCRVGMEACATARCRAPETSGATGASRRTDQDPPLGRSRPR